MAFLQPVEPPEVNSALYNNHPQMKYQPAPLSSQAPQNFLQPASPISYAQQMNVYEDLVGSKLGYDVTDKQIQFGNQLLTDPDLTNEQKQKAQATIEGLQKQRDSFADYANSVRDAATAMGFGDNLLEPYGSGKTLAEATQALNNYSATAVRDLLATKTVDEQEQARFDELVARGVSPSQAHRLINRNHAKVQGDYERRIADGILTFGTNADGSLNEVGLTLINSAANSAPKTAGLFGNSFALPKDIFTTQADFGKAQMLTDAQSGMLEKRLQAQAQIAEMRERARRENLLLSLDNKWNIEQFRQKNENARTGARLNAQYELKGMELNANSVGGKFMQYYQLALASGKTPKEAMDYAMKQVSKSDPEKDGSAVQGVFNVYDTIFSFMAQGDDDSAGKLLHSLSEKRETGLDEFAGKFDSKDYQTILDLERVFGKYLDVTGNPDDPAFKKARAEAFDVAIAHYNASKRGTDPADELAAQKQARALRRRNGGDKTNNDANKPYNDVDQANDRVRKMLEEAEKTKQSNAYKVLSGTYPQWGTFGYFPITPRR